MVKRQLEKYGPWRSLGWDRSDPGGPPPVLREAGSVGDDRVSRGGLADRAESLRRPLLASPAGVPSPGRAAQRSQTDLTPLSELDVSGYDLVISLQPCLPEEWMRGHRGTSFYYFLNEHDNHEYEQIGITRSRIPGASDHLAAPPLPTDPRLARSRFRTSRTLDDRRCFPRPSLPSIHPGSTSTHEPSSMRQQASPQPMGREV